MEEIKQRYDSVNIMRMVSALLVIAIHTSIFGSINQTANDIVTKGISRIAVPFFFISTGYFMFKNINRQGYIKSFIKRLVKIYLIIGVIDVLLIMPYVSVRLQGGFIKALQVILIGGITESLWYVPAIILSVLVVSVFIKKNWVKPLVIVSILLYIIGLLGDSYYGLIVNTPLEKIVDIYKMLFINTRNGITFSVPFVAIGALMAKGNIANSIKNIKYAVLGFSILLGIEGYLLNANNIAIDTNMYISLILLVPAIFLCLLNLKFEISERTSNILREMSLWVYCVHETIMLMLLIYVGNFNTIMMFLIVSSISIFIAYLISAKKVKIPAVNIKKERVIAWSFLALAIIILATNSIKGSKSVNNSSTAFNLDGEATDIVGPLYKISDENSSLYIYGYYSAGTQDMYPLNEAVQEAVKNSDGVVVEVNTPNPSDNRYIELSMYAKDDSIEKHITSEALEILKEISSEKNMRFDQIKSYKPIPIGSNFRMLYSEVEGHSMNYSPQGFVEAFASKYEKDKIPMMDIYELLTDMVSVSNEVEDASIKLIKYYKEIKPENLIKSLELWKNGDLEAFNKFDSVEESLNDTEKKEYQKINDVYKKHNDELNNKYYEIYLGKLKDFMKEDKNYFVSISSDFMGGENGILERLIKEGYKVEKIDKK
ncbi:acyltransferase family protein [Clostridium sp. 1001275B_160808_H3]|uniref:acyltransferase family protein n=1 Tax=Clostridium sp. 1001275B_160808_H3 TaxID=2787110 RepID=UPI00189941A9|nr:acyltransferase family protein [Clostridium sp. 1001275B_160808_H3]